MKLFVYCPEEFYESNSPQWEKALLIANQTKLPIASNIKGFSELQEPTVVSVPDKKFVDVDESVKSGFIHKIDITDEFCVFDGVVEAIFTASNGETYVCRPIVKEQHGVKFRTRHEEQGTYKVVVMNNNMAYLERLFTVV